MIDNRAKTIICDIDGTLVKHSTPSTSSHPEYLPELLPGTLAKFAEWDVKGYNIILMTGRRESARAATQKQLSRLGIFYDHLIMGIGGGERILINDSKPNGEVAVRCINIERDKGIIDVNI
jgi:hypothetical protein